MSTLRSNKVVLMLLSTAGTLRGSGVRDDS
jgi:hypothetical protein